ncbi:MAG: ABC transporter permease [Anaerolineae bacterium]|jgi:peptide/nickel transport system permease protein
MARFVIRRLVRGLVALILFQSLLFALVHALPYDFSSLFLSGPSYRSFIQQYLGLDQPMLVQYARWLGGFARFDLGRSYLYWPTPVSDILWANLPRTLILFLTAALLAYAFGIWLGKLMAWRRGGLLEAGATLGGVAAYTSFAPFLGFLLIAIFGRELGWFSYQRLVDHNVWYDAPVTVDWLLARLVVTGLLVAAGTIFLWWLTRRLRAGWLHWLARAGGILALLGLVAWAWARSPVAYLALDVANHLVLPLLTVILLSFGETMMLMRMAMLETMREEYVLTAQAIGFPDRVIRDRHVARNAILPVITRLALNLPFVLVGSLVIERVFLWTAMGQAVFSAVEFYDVPLLLGVMSVVGVLTLLAHIGLDILYVYLDPRLRYAPGS